MEQLPERHLECSECKKPVTVIYTEIVGKMIYRLSMCSDCPILQQKLKGSLGTVQYLDTKAGLVCGNCGMSAEEVKRGVPLGCSLCYEVFEDLLIQELIVLNKISPALVGVKRVTPLHIGKMPGQTIEITPAMKLVQLHQALNETLKKEDYEQAAWLRDQIRQLTDGEKKNGQ